MHTMGPLPHTSLRPTAVCIGCLHHIIQSHTSCRSPHALSLALSISSQVSTSLLAPLHTQPKREELKTTVMKAGKVTVRRHIFSGQWPRAIMLWASTGLHTGRQARPPRLIKGIYCMLMFTGGARAPGGACSGLAGGACSSSGPCQTASPVSYASAAAPSSRGWQPARDLCPRVCPPLGTAAVERMATLRPFVGYR